MEVLGVPRMARFTTWSIPRHGIRLPQTQKNLPQQDRQKVQKAGSTKADDPGYVLDSYPFFIRILTKWGDNPILLSAHNAPRAQAELPQAVQN